MWVLHHCLRECPTHLILMFSPKYATHATRSSFFPSVRATCNSYVIFFCWCLTHVTLTTLFPALVPDSIRTPLFSSLWDFWHYHFIISFSVCWPMLLLRHCCRQCVHVILRNYFRQSVPHLLITSLFPSERASCASYVILSVRAYLMCFLRHYFCQCVPPCHSDVIISVRASLMFLWRHSFSQSVPHVLLTSFFPSEHTSCDLTLLFPLPAWLICL